MHSPIQLRSSFGEGVATAAAIFTFEWAPLVLPQSVVKCVLELGPLVRMRVASAVAGDVAVSVARRFVDDWSRVHPWHLVSWPLLLSNERADIINLVGGLLCSAYK